MDAFTAKECICFNMKILDEHVPVAVDVLSDLVLHPVFDGNDIQRERRVILEEIKMDEDSPDYLVHEIFTQSFWKDHALGKPILGTRDTVKRFERAVVSEHYMERFAPGNLIVAAAGNLDHVGQNRFGFKTLGSARLWWNRPRSAINDITADGQHHENQCQQGQD